MPQEWENANDNDVVNRWERTRFVRNPKNVYEEKFEKKKKEEICRRKASARVQGRRHGPAQTWSNLSRCNSCTIVQFMHIVKKSVVLPSLWFEKVTQVHAHTHTLQSQAHCP